MGDVGVSIVRAPGIICYLLQAEHIEIGDAACFSEGAPQIAAPINAAAPLHHQYAGAQIPWVFASAGSKIGISVMDADASWIVLDEATEFVWPGVDLGPVSRTTPRF
jgi:hypothetical protein